MQRFLNEHLWLLTIFLWFLPKHFIISYMNKLFIVHLFKIDSINFYIDCIIYIILIIYYSTKRCEVDYRYEKSFPSCVIKKIKYKIKYIIRCHILDRC